MKRNLAAGSLPKQIRPPIEMDMNNIKPGCAIVNIKNRLREYLHGKGIELNQSGLICCPWHDDKNPSCKVNDDYLYCYSCHESGDIYKTAAALIGVPCDKKNFREIANDIEQTLGIPAWKPQHKSGNLKLSESAIYRSELLKDFAKNLNTGDIERAYYCANLLFALFMLPEDSEKTIRDKKTALQARMVGYGIGQPYGGAL